ncbi:MAG: hypothetical protein N4A54_04620 [Peptostreptococcaceae bacterium]|nr:hypothetical protein [Peptostreptococcaceae bacterium]
MLKRIMYFFISLVVFITTIGANSVSGLIHQEEDFYCNEISNFYDNIETCNNIINSFFEKDIKQISEDDNLYVDFEINIKRINLFKEVLTENDMESKSINKLLDLLHYIKDSYKKDIKEDILISEYLNLNIKIKENIKKNMVVNKNNELRANKYKNEKYETNLIEDILKSKNEVLLNFVQIIDEA